ncbi:MAG: tetratricopeptide repeat protein [Bacteroidales bacterium]
MNKLILIAITLLLFVTSCGSRMKVASSDSSLKPLLSSEQARLSQYYLMEGIRYKAIEQHDVAFDYLTKSLEVDSLNSAALFVISNYYLTLNDPLRALNSLQKAVSVDSTNYWYLFSSANLSQQMNLNQEASEYYKRLIAGHPSNPELDYSLSEVYANMGEIEKSIQTLDKLEEKVGPMEVISLQKSRLYSSINQEDKAKEEMDKLIAHFPNQIHYRILMGDISLGKGDLSAANSYYQSAKSVDPNNGQLQLSLANYYTQIGEKDSADMAIESALRNSTLEIESKLDILEDYLKTLYLKKEGMKEVESLFSILLESNPQNVKLYKLYASYLITEGEFSKALTNLDIAVGLEPTSKELWLQALDVSFRAQDFSASEKLCERALEYHPKVGEFYYYRSVALGVDSLYSQAISVLEDGLTKMENREPKFLSACYTHIADLYHLQDNMLECFNYYEKAIEVYPDNASALNNYAYFLSLDNVRLNDAEKMSGRAVKLEPENSTYLDTYAWIYFKQGNYFLAKVYIEMAIRNGGDKSDVIIEHYGDILYQNGDVDKAVEQWKLSLELGSKSESIHKKIEERRYID